jgi:hypothetical protein
MDSQTREQGGREFSEPPPPPPLPHEHDSPLDHNSERAYVRTDNGLDTLTTSPLIHVQVADKRMLAFVAPAIPTVEKVAIPPLVDTVVDPNNDTDIGDPVDPLTYDTTLTVHGTGGDDDKTCCVAPLTSSITKG